LSPTLQIGMALGSVAILLGLMAIVRRIAHAAQIGPEVQRKLVHIGTGLYAMTLPWLFPDRWPIYLLVAVTIGVMLALRMPSSKLGKTLHGVERQSYGDLMLALAVGLCLFFAEGELYLYGLPIAVLTLADAAAALAGTTYGTRFFKVEDGQKSFEGSLVFFIVTMLVAMICLMLMTPFAPINIIVLALMVAVFGTLVEALSWQGFDNIFLPLGLLVFLSVHGESDLRTLLGLAAVFAVALALFKTVSPIMGLSTHAAYVYVIAAFLVLAVSEVQNTLFPIAMLAAHAWCRGANPGVAKFPDLDIVASLALVSFGWLALGNATGWNAVSFYGLTTMGILLGLSALALAHRPFVIRLSVLVVLVLTACVLRIFILGLNPVQTNWFTAIWPLTFVCIAFTVMIPASLPQAFYTARVSKLTVLALTPPLFSYLFAIDIAGLFI
jgi:phytol kinase